MTQMILFFSLKKKRIAFTHKLYYIHISPIAQRETKPWKCRQRPLPIT